MLTILVVDDDPDVRAALVEVLEVGGHEALEAGNGRQALELLRAAREPPAGIVLDLMMPVMDGAAFLVARAAFPRLASIPVILLTATPDLARDLPLADLGVALLLGKPLADPDELLDAVASVAPADLSRTLEIEGPRFPRARRHTP